MIILAALSALSDSANSVCNISMHPATLLDNAPNHPARPLMSAVLSLSRFPSPLLKRHRHLQDVCPSQELAERAHA